MGFCGNSLCVVIGCLWTEGDVDVDDAEPKSTSVAATVARSLASGKLPMSVQTLTKALHTYQLRPAHGALSFDTLPHVEGSGEGDYDYNACIAFADAASGSGAAGA